MDHLPVELRAFARQAPFAIAGRAVFEHLFRAEALDSWFRDNAFRQYERELTFSSLVDLMAAVTFRRQSSVRKAYLADPTRWPVTLSAVYQKLQGVEPSVCAALVADTSVPVPLVLGHVLSNAERRAPREAASDVSRPAPVPGSVLVPQPVAPPIAGESSGAGIGVGVGPKPVRVRTHGVVIPVEFPARVSGFRHRTGTAPFPDRDRLAEVEQAVLQSIDPPLNLMGMPPTPVRIQLRQLRRQLRQGNHGSNS